MNIQIIKNLKAPPLEAPLFLIRGGDIEISFKINYQPVKKNYVISYPKQN